MTKSPEEIARELLLREVNRLRAASNYPAMDMETLWREGDILLDVKSLSTAITLALLAERARMAEISALEAQVNHLASELIEVKKLRNWLMDEKSVLITKVRQLECRSIPYRSHTSDDAR